jgi:hypothetical protein
MEKSEKKKSKIEQTAEDLFNFTVDREDLKTLMASLPEEADVNCSKVEYELQILKIISVGWSISYFLGNSAQKQQLSEIFWEAVREFSQELSTATEYMIGQEIDYFQILKDRLNKYVKVLEEKTDAPEPAVVVGPEFAEICGNSDNVYTVMIGSRMFVSTIGGVKEYLEEIKLR